MSRYLCLAAGAALLAIQSATWSQGPSPNDPKRLADGVYLVRRDSSTEKDVQPLKEGERLAVDRHRYLKNPGDEPPQFIVVASAPDVALDLVGEPKAVKDKDGNMRILVTLQPAGAKALERLTLDHVGRQLTIIIGGEVVSTHKIRGVIKQGEVQISSCAPGGAEFILQQLRDRPKHK